MICSMWKPLNGPLRDWPLAVCDLTSLDLQTDLVAADDVRIMGYSELFQVVFNPAQKRRYLDKQMDSELLIFRTADSDFKGGGLPLQFSFSPRCVGLSTVST